MSPRSPAPSAPLACLLACATLAGCGGSGGAAAPQRETLATARDSGRHAQATTQARLQRPAELLLRVSAAPKQRVTVSWGMSCPKTAGGRAKGTGDVYGAVPPSLRALRLPARPIAFCAISARARLSRSGRVKIAVIGRERG